LREAPDGGIATLFAQVYFKRKYADLVDEAEELIRTADRSTR
jgi:hypothetical protein